MLKIQIVLLMLASVLFAQSKAQPRSGKSARSTTPSQSAARNDWMIVPGIRVGPITEATTHEDLVRLFGAASVKDQDIDVGEGFSEPGVVIYGDDPSRTLSIIWETEYRGRVVFVCANGARACRWRTANGISLGTSLRTLEAINGKRFTMAGFGFDYSGTVISWDGGTLDTHGRGRLLLRLDYSRTAASAVTRKQLDSVIGDREFPSSNPVMRRLNPTVYQILFDFPK